MKIPAKQIKCTSASSNPLYTLSWRRLAHTFFITPFINSFPRRIWLVFFQGSFFFLKLFIISRLALFLLSKMFPSRALSAETVWKSLIFIIKAVHIKWTEEPLWSGELFLSLHIRLISHWIAKHTGLCYMLPCFPGSFMADRWLVILASL